MDALPQNELEEIRKQLDESKNPLFLFHDDSDGLASFLLLYSRIKEGTGLCCKTHKVLSNRFFNLIQSLQPDSVFILDVPALDQDFIDKLPKPITYIDHHPPPQLKGAKLYNPRLHDPNNLTSVASLCYDIADKKSEVWLAMIGSVGDWQFETELANAFKKQYPDLLPESIKTPDKALYESPLGQLIKIYNFSLKGDSKEVQKAIKIFTQIDNPYTLLNEETKEAAYIMRRYKRIAKEYDKLLTFALSKVTDEKVLFVEFGDVKISFTGEIANELLYRYPDKVILITRKHAGYYKSSLRTSTKSKLILPSIIDKALLHIPNATGGGHEHSCGSCIPIKYFPLFLEKFKKEIETI